MSDEMGDFCIHMLLWIYVKLRIVSKAKWRGLK